ncbi:hypothetical protein IHE45_15G037900 [Dioscorea alata]|uniref:Uncharacterized protein n=1 Tax=Dioscorea alata TaxID=55571 RepID=A0ACB7UKN1_DIOAL|nr:hypothetical protein IHE45_15G037900 [Dioscorea alata]
MGCFFACFRMKDENQRSNQMVSQSISTKNRDPLVSRHQLGSVFLSEEKENGSSCERVERSNLRDSFQKEDLIDNELKNEAKFLKSCGALLETPGEIRKASQRTVSHGPHEEKPSSNFHSWLPGTSLNKLLWDEPLDHHSLSPKKHVYEDSQSPGKVHGRSVNFEDKKQMSGSASPSHPESQTKQVGPKPLPSPYPTPLKLNDEMQTPGTVYPTKLENFGTGKNVRIRTQYLYPVLNPVENTSQWKALSGGSHLQVQSSEIIVQGRGPDAGENNQQLNKMHTPTPKDSKSSLSPGIASPNAKGNQNIEMSYDDKYVSCNSPSSVIPLLDNREKVFLRPNDEQLVVSSLSQWLKPLPVNGERGKDHDTINENSHSGKSPSGDRPILGTVAAHWNEDEPSHISPKWWDGNGIPNSTNKYKEDQKVKWHATPFEERLEKALSEEKLFPPRENLEAKIMEFDYEGEESDTAAS